MNSLRGDVALITGAASGIGTATARLFAARGAAVAVHGRDAEAVARLVAQITTTGAHAVGVVGDLTDEAAVKRVVAEAEVQLGPLTVLIANAGGNIVPPGPIESLTAEQWRATIDKNLTLTFLTIAAALPGMRKRRRGSIVTIASAASRRPTAQTPVAYAAAKAGVEVLTRIVAAEAGPDGVRVNCIAPETVLTERNSLRLSGDAQHRLIDVHPIRRLGTPDDIAEAALFLAGGAASWITGVVLDVAGGSVLA